MDALIFAAGLGTRLRPLTNDRPKALVMAGGKTLLERAVARVAAAGARRAIVNIHHFAPLMREFIESHQWPIPLVVSDESELLLDTGGGLLNADPLIDPSEPLLIHNVDIISDIDLEAMVRAHTESGADITLAVSHRSSSRRLMFGPDGSLRGWLDTRSGATLPEGLNTAALTPLAFSGIHLLSPEAVMPVLRSYAPAEAFPIVPFYVKSANALDIRAFVSDAPVVDLGTPQALAAAFPNQ